jgi:hypothetical protein
MGAAAQADMERNRRVFSGGAVGSSVVKSNSNNGSAVAATTSRGQVNIFDDDDDHDHVDKNDVDVDVDDDVHEVVEDDVVSVPNRLSFGMRSGLPPVQRNSIDSSSASDDVVMRNPARLDVPILIDELPPDTIVAPPDSASAALSSLSSSVLLAPLCNDLDQCLDDFESLPARQSLMRDADLQQDDDAAAGNGDLEFELDAPSKSKRKGGARSRLRFKYPLDCVVRSARRVRRRTRRPSSG